MVNGLHPEIGVKGHVHFNSLELLCLYIVFVFVSFAMDQITFYHQWTQKTKKFLKSVIAFSCNHININ